jgi:hypothetical protein
MADLTQSTTSRYRNTRLYSDGGAIFYGTWKPPKILLTKPITTHVVAVDEWKRPDLVAYRVYGDPNMFWPIALCNNINMPLIDMEPGQNLACPSIEDISSALSSSSSISSGTY